tara:strand:+ start:128 stop:451 length:324 start_codon:yes stop_codon:yes gene_type:complete
MTKKYEVLMATTYGEWVEVEADNEEQAVDKANEGEWETVVKSSMTDRYSTGDVREIVGEPIDSKAKLYDEIGVPSSGARYNNHLPRLIKEIEDRAELKNVEDNKDEH